MLKNRKLEKIQEGAELLFKLMFLLYTMVSVNNITFGTRIVSLCMWPTFLLGAILLVLRAVEIKKYIKMPFLWLLICMTASFGLSILVNKPYELKKNIVILILWLFYFFLLYTTDTMRDRKKIQKEYRLMSYAFLAYTSVCVLISLGMMIVGYHNSYVTYDDHEIASGFIWGRLWGTFLDPNYGAAMVAVGIVLAVFVIRKTRKNYMRALMGINIVLYICYIAFSDSRSGKLCLGIAAAVLVFCGLVRRENNKLSLKKWIVTAVIAAASFAVAAAIPQGVTKVYNLVQSQDQGEEEDNSIHRGYDLEGDISNRRFDLWMGGIEVWQTSPVTGIAFANLKPYSIENVPDSYLVDNTMTQFQTLDNEPLDILVSQGIIGEVIFIVLVISVVVYVFKRIRYVKKEDELLVDTLLAVLASIFMCSIFRTGMFYYNAPMSNMFWMSLGTIIMVLSDIAVSRKREVI